MYAKVVGAGPTVEPGICDDEGCVTYTIEVEVAMYVDGAAVSEEAPEPT